MKKSLKDVIVYPLIIVDGNNVAYKYKCPPFSTFSTSKGMKTGVLYGMFRFLIFLYKNFATPLTQVIFCWDTGGKSLRKTISKEYKSKRDHSGDSDLFDQIKMFASEVEHYGYQSIHSPELYEADDVAATIVHHAYEKKRMPILLVSEDKDWLQLVSSKKSIHLYTPKSKQVITETLDFSFEVFSSLAGDAVDGVSAARGLSKSDVMLMSQKFDTVEAMISYMEQVKYHPLQKAVLALRDKLRKNSELVKLYYIKEIEEQIRLERQQPNEEKLLKFLSWCEFTKVEGYLI